MAKTPWVPLTPPKPPFTTTPTATMKSAAFPWELRVHQAPGLPPATVAPTPATNYFPGSERKRKLQPTSRVNRHRLMRMALTTLWVRNVVRFAQAARAYMSYSGPTSAVPMIQDPAGGEIFPDYIDFVPQSPDTPVVDPGGGLIFPDHVTFTPSVTELPYATHLYPTGPMPPISVTEPPLPPVFRDYGMPFGPAGYGPTDRTDIHLFGSPVNM